MTKRIIKQFIGKYRFLSNFYPTKIIINGKKYPSTEHYYQAMKFKDPSLQEKVRKAPSPARAKEIAHKFSPQEDWKDISLDIMEKGLRAKFKKPTLQKKLLDTKDAILQEGNTWGDKFWGVDLKTGEGKNHLGKLLMKIRDEFK